MIKEKSKCKIIKFLGIDPRSNPTDIQAIGLEDVVITDGNGTIISHQAKTTSKRESESEESEEESVEESAEQESEEDETKNRSKRQAPGKNENGEDKSEIQPVSLLIFTKITIKHMTIIR